MTGEIGVRLTNAREVASFFIACAIVAAIHFLMTPVLPTPLYVQMLHSGAAALMDVTTSSFTFVTWAVTLPLFLLLRGRVGGAPPIVAGRGRQNAVTSSIGEVVSYVSAVLIVMVVVLILNEFVPAGVYMALWQSGLMAWTEPVSLALFAASAVVVFLIFIALRGAIPDAAIPDVFD